MAVWISMVLLGVPYAFLLGVSAAVLELIPIVGPIFAGSVAVLVAFSQTFNLALYTLIIFVAIQQLESSVLIPLVMKHQVGLHPALVLVALLAGSALAGIIGIILAVPITVFLQELVEGWSEEKRKRPQLAI
jgi:predicted PurR-regulated permease PerM